MQLTPRVLTLSLFLLLAALFFTGCHAGAGPTIGYTFDRGPSYGWEVSGGAAWARASAGGVYRPSTDLDGGKKAPTTKTPPPEGPTEAVYHLALEPSFFAGGTLGVGHSSDDGFSPVAGVWVGSPIPKLGFDCSGDPDFGYYLSGAVGYRYIGGEHEVYFTPKVGAIECQNLF